MRKPLLVLAAPLALISPMADAEIYRWVDEDGVVNYTQHKPESRPAERIRSPRLGTSRAEPAPAPAETTTQAKLSEEQQRMLDDLKAKEAERQAQITEIRRSNCDKSRAVLERLTQTDRIRIRGDDGQERIIGEDERQARIDEAQDGIVKNCEPS